MHISCFWVRSCWKIYQQPLQLSFPVPTGKSKPGWLGLHRWALVWDEDHWNMSVFTSATISHFLASDMPLFDNDKGSLCRWSHRVFSLCWQERLFPLAANNKHNTRLWLALNRQNTAFNEGRLGLNVRLETNLLIHLSANSLTKMHLCQVKREQCGVVGVRVTQWSLCYFLLR